MKDTATVLEPRFASVIVVVSCSRDLPHSLSRRASSIISEWFTSIHTNWLSFEGNISASWIWNRSLPTKLHNAYLASKSSEVKGNRSRRDCNKRKSEHAEQICHVNGETMDKLFSENTFKAGCVYSKETDWIKVSNFQQ